MRKKLKESTAVLYVFQEFVNIDNFIRLSISVFISPIDGTEWHKDLDLHLGIIFRISRFQNFSGRNKELQILLFLLSYLSVYLHNR